MRIRIAVPEEHVSPEVIEPVLEAVSRLNERMLAAGQTPSASELIKQGAVWKPEPWGEEHFDNAQTIAERGWGDCDDWAPARVAELRASGEDPNAHAIIVPSGPSTYHALVQRGDGRRDDPSVAAGMKPLKGGASSSVIGSDGSIEVLACDPHDPSHVYSGSLAPTLSPLSLHCGPSFAVRGVLVHGRPLFEGRCDMPIAGSRMVRVRSHGRVQGNHHRNRAQGRIGYLPSFISCSGFGSSPRSALAAAFNGALEVGASSGITNPIDQYKLIAMQGAMQGMTPGQVKELLVKVITSDVHEKSAMTGLHPAEHVAELAQHAAASGIKIPAPPRLVVGDFFSDIGHIASGVVDSVSKAANAVANVVKAVPWGDIIHDVEAAASAIPGLGTAVSDVVAAAETAYESAAALLKGNPLEAAIDAAYNFALASVPGAAALHPILDPVKETLIDLTVKKEPIADAVMNGILQAVPDSPSFAGINPRSVAASLAHLIIGKLGTKKTGQAPVKPDFSKGGQARGVTPGGAPKPHPSTLPKDMPSATRARRPIVHRPAPPVSHPVARAILANKPQGVPHAAMHTDAVVPGSPGAPAGATVWQCILQPGGHYVCRWV